MIKYIRTYYNNEKVILRMVGCQQCPLMSVDQNTLVSKCKYFHHEKSNIVKNIIDLYSSDKNKVYDHIEIPIWCKLPDTYSDILRNTYTFKILKSGILIDTNDKEGEDLQILSFYKKDLEILMNKFIHDDTESPNTQLVKYTKQEYNDSILDNTYKKDNSIKIFKECSLCGEEDETVDRNKNIGMCDMCWELCQNNDNKKRQAFINNFRLKRSVKMNTIEFKIVKEIII